MFTSIIASTAFMAVAVLAQSPGRAVVTNGCKYQVFLANTPAADGGYDAISNNLQPGETYSQTFTELTNGMGWSLKLAKQESFGTQLMQFEYTYHPGEPIWFDLSDVDGNPWDGDWEITAAGDTGCAPKHTAYRYSTDDAYGMQSCDASTDITVLLCSGEDQNDGLASAVGAGRMGAGDIPAAASSVASSVAEAAPASSAPASFVNAAAVSPSEVAPTTTAAAPTTPSTSAAPTTAAPTTAEEEPSTSAAPSPSTTFATQVTMPPGAPVIVTEFATAVVTEIVTATHFARAEQHEHRHAHRHPHARA